MTNSDEDRTEKTLAGGAKPRDVDTIDSIIGALYSAISFTAGERPNLDRFRSLFVPPALLVHAPADEAGLPVILDTDAFVRQYETNMLEGKLADRGFAEREIGRRVERFGNAAHVMSAYESLVGGDVAPSARGVNCFQLARAQGRWWILGIVWDDEREGNALPEGLLGAGL